MEDTPITRQIHATLSAALKTPGIVVTYIQPGLLKVVAHDKDQGEYVLNCSLNDIIADPLSVLAGLENMFGTVTGGKSRHDGN